MTGRAAGYCAGNDAGGFMNGSHRGFGGGPGWGGRRGGGLGRFRQRWWPRGLRGGAEIDAPLEPADEPKVAGLQRMVERLQEAVGELEDQIRGGRRPKGSQAPDTPQEKP
jgi:hypothetical protein